MRGEVRQLYGCARAVECGARAGLLYPHSLFVFAKRCAGAVGELELKAIVGRHDELGAPLPLSHDRAGVGLEQPAVSVEELRALAQPKEEKANVGQVAPAAELAAESGQLSAIGSEGFGGGPGRG